MVDGTSLASVQGVSAARIRVGPAVVAALMLEAAAGVAVAAPGDPRAVRGVQEWQASLVGERFVVVRGDDGQAYYADIASARRRGDGPFNAGSRVSVVGVEGGRPWELAAGLIGAGDSALAELPAPPASEAPVAASPPTAVTVPPSPPPAVAPAPPAARPPEPAAPKENWRRFEGTVDSISGSQLVLRTPDQGSVTLDLSGLGGQVRTLRPGDSVTVFAVPRESGSLVVTGFVQSQRAPDPSPPTR